MKTLGVDLSSQPEKTGACLIEWACGKACVLAVKSGLADEDILELAKSLALADGQNAIGIDAPFGWPQPFVQFVSRSPPESSRLGKWDSALRKHLSYRLTDHRVREDVGLVPLAVAADKIALPAMRCAGLLADLGVTDRSGAGGVYEVYPAAALKRWGVPWQKYKGKDGAAKALRQEMLASIRKSCPWLRFVADADSSYVEHNDDAFDALIASLVARAAALGRTALPRDDYERDLAQLEGWIAVPCGECSLRDLGTD